MKQSKKLVLIFSLWLTALSSAVHAAPWQLATIWAPGFCATSRSDASLCQSANAKADHLLSSHLVSPQGQCTESRRHFAAAFPNKAQEAYVAIATAADWEERWKQYGSCSGFTPERYLSTNVEMAKMIGQTSLGKLLKENQGQWVTKDKLLTALRYDYFIGADSKATLVCRQNRLIGVLFYPRDWSELFVKTEQGGMLDKAPTQNAFPAASECPDQLQL